MNAPGSEVTAFSPGSSIARDYLRGGIVLGRALLRPTFDIGLESDSNFLTTQAARGSTGLFTVAPGLELEVPALRSGFRLSYSPVMRFFNTSELPSSNLAHRFDGDFSTRLSPLLQLGVRWHGVRSTFDTLEFDPAREVFFSQQPFWRHDVAVQADYRLSERSSVGMTVSVNSVGFKSQPSPQDFFFDYTTTIVGLGYSHRVTPRHTVRLGFEGGTNASLRAQNALDPRLNNFRLYQPGFTILSQLTPTMTGQLGVALRVQRFPHATRSFTGPQISLSLEKSLSGNAAFSLSALHTTVLSAFNPEQGSAFAVSTGADARLSKRIGPNLSGTIGTDYQRLSFPVPVGARSSFGGVSLGQFAGSRRSDDLLGARIEIAFRAHSLATLTVGYVFHERNSTLLPFAFERSRFKMGVTLGRWIPTKINSRRF
jgi:hypothetical protein